MNRDREDVSIVIGRHHLQTAINALACYTPGPDESIPEFVEEGMRRIDAIKAINDSMIASENPNPLVAHK